MLQISNSINFNWYFHFHTYIHDLIVLTTFLHLKAQIKFMLKLDLISHVNWFHIQTYHCFHLVFQLVIFFKYTSYFTFQLVSKIYNIFQLLFKIS